MLKKKHPDMNMTQDVNTNKTITIDNTEQETNTTKLSIDVDFNKDITW